MLSICMSVRGNRKGCNSQMLYFHFPRVRGTYKSKFSYRDVFGDEGLPSLTYKKYLNEKILAKSLYLIYSCSPKNSNQSEKNGWLNSDFHFQLNTYNMGCAVIPDCQALGTGPVAESDVLVVCVFR